MVLTTAMLLLTLVLAVLSVTINSRRITARYEYFFGLYDLAVAGNEQAYYTILQALALHSNYAHNRAQARAVQSIHENPARLITDGDRYILYPPDYYLRLFIQEITPHLRQEIRRYFPPHQLEYRRFWGITLDFGIAANSGNLEIQDTYQATTTITPEGGAFVITTRIYKYIGEDPGRVAVVQSRLRWLSPERGEEYANGRLNINYLDYYTLEMVELLRIAD